MQPVRDLPVSYQSVGTLDITKDKRALFFLNFVGLIMLMLTGWLFIQTILWLRGPESVAKSFSLEINNAWQVVILLGSVILLTGFYVSFHEAIHGLLFWWFTHSRPLFAFRWTHAYAAAPDWYLPRNSYLVTALAPLFLITIIGLLMIVVAPPSWLAAVWFVLTMNASGSVGDLLVAGWLLRQPQTCLARDCGDSISLYVPVK